MKCPNDSAVLVMSERSGVEIDYCPECRGVWLDRGELDKIIDRAEAEFAAAAPSIAPAAPQQPQQPQYQQPQYQQPRYGDRDDDRRGYNDGYRPKKKENWLGELFG
jgi:Zn-finger nucleic acid-binding protein